MNISSSVVTPPTNGQASQKPSPAPAVESHERLRSASVVPLHGARTLPCVQFVGTAHGPPIGSVCGGGGDVERFLTWLGSVNPLSYSAQNVSVRSASSVLVNVIGGSG